VKTAFDLQIFAKFVGTVEVRSPEVKADHIGDIRVLVFLPGFGSAFLLWKLSTNLLCMEAFRDIYRF
jgi:hypothetical protein